MTAGGSSTILIVSESHPDPDLNLGFLRQPEIRLLHCASETAALDVVEAAPPDLIIDDLAAGAPSESELCRRLKTHPATCAIPVILVTSARAEVAPAGNDADVVLRKPLVPREFFEVVRRYVSLPARRHLRHPINVRFQFRHGGRLVQAFSRDLSTHGTFLKTDRVLPAGSHLELHFRLPDGTSEVRCGGVVRSVPKLQSAARGMGIEFEGIHDEDLERLERFLERQRPRSFFGLFS
jgi:uncharacterized protein (TIGR02266 family)